MSDSPHGPFETHEPVAIDEPVATDEPRAAGDPLEAVRAVSERIENDSLRAWRARGGKVVGYACTFTPVEVIEAAGALPFRIRALGHPRTDRADARMSRFNCRFCRACLQLGLDGTYGFLDGLVQSNGCDQLRGMFENWQRAAGVPFFHYLKAPHGITPESLDHFTLEIRRLRDALQAELGVRITDDDLGEAVTRHGRIRHKLAEVSRLRERPQPALSGSEALQLALAQGAVPAHVFEGLLDGLLAALPGRSLEPGRARLLVGGAATDEPRLLATVEDLGGQVVADTLCYGTRAFLPQATAQPEDPGEAGAGPPDPLRALAERYLRGSLCPRMYEAFEDRARFLERALRRAGVQGVILLNNKFCDLHGFDNAMLARRLREAGHPVLSLEKDYGSPADQGRIRTRVQAFLERIDAREPLGGAA
jgi:benzoyl-CoA reductase/2-hydroxyglutaryl-CoA dehydratase subunit BcrC/BadD/HgdB